MPSSLARPRAWLFWIALAVLPTVVAVADDKPSAARALRAAEAPLRDRRWDQAATALAQMRKDWPGTPEAIEAAVLEARALLLAGKPRASLDVATEFLKANGDATFTGRMKGTLADAYGALKAGADEAKALRERAELLTGDDHRAKIAALYVKLGDDDFDGVDAKDDLGRAVKKKDFAKAREAYARALELGVAAADRLRVRARIALSAEELGDWGTAIATWDDLLKRNATASADDRETWLVGRGRARLRAGQTAEARKDLRDARTQFPKGKRALEALRLAAEERFLAANGPEGDLAFEEGVLLLRQAIGEHRDDPEAPAVQASLATAYAGRGQHQKAAGEWRGLVERFPTHVEAPTWRNAVAESLAAANRFDEAVTEWKAFLSSYPNHPLWQQVQERIPAARYRKAEVLRDEGDKDGAIAAWRAFAEEYPTDPRAPRALLEVGGLLRERKDFEGAIAVWRGVTGRYAPSAEAPVAWFLVATTLEDDLGRLDEAVKEYEALLKQYGSSGPAREAQARLARLRGKHLEVRGERVVGSADATVLKVVTRNVSALKVRVYKLSIEEYFRRKQTVAGVENVQVEIVKPDLTAEWKLDPYVPFALIQAERPVPTTGPGAYVVVAGDDDLTSTTLLLVSDVEAVVKAASGRQVFVWARNRTTGAPEKGARVLVSDGTSVYAEGVTGADGVWQVDTDRAARRVLVMAGAHAASSEWEPGQSFAEGWQTKVHLSTDRPVYRPGQQVKWRGIFRRADGGAYVVPKAVKAVAVLLNARGAEVERADVTCSDLGIYEGAFALDAEAPLGDWSIHLDVDGRSFPGAFRVLEYRKPEFTVEVLPGKPSYATGEEVKATVRLRYTFGGAVAGAPVEWQVTRVPRDFTPSAVNDYSWYVQDPDALQRAREAARVAPRGAIVARGAATTDDRGETSISFPTTERDEDAEYVVTASAIDVTRRPVMDEGRIPVVRRDHWAVVTTDAKVYRPKQELRATVITVDANQSPVSRSGKVALVRVKRSARPMPPTPTPRDAGIGKDRPFPIQEEEIEVQAVPVSTDAKGRAEVRIVLPGPGLYRARWTSTDARGALVTAFAPFDVAGDAEDLSKDARLVAAKETYTEGDRAEVLLQSPVSGVKALLTFEGEKVLAYRLVDVTGPSTILDVPVEGAYAPNVTLKIAVPSKDRLLEAQDEIVVFRYLEVRVTPSKETVGPGEEVTFDVTTTDASGKPVSAAVGVSVVDDALFRISPDLSPAIRPFFYDRKRVNRVVTSSSVGFRTYGTTRETNKELLANAEAQGADANRVFAQSALRLARAAIQRGDMETAVAQALRASQADPDSWDARQVLSELQTRPDAQEALKQMDAFATGAEDAKKALDDVRTESASKEGAAGRGDTAFRKRAGAPSAGPSLAPKPRAPAGEGGLHDAEPARRSESDEEDSPAEKERLADGTIGSGGGAGGGFKGKGGKRNLRAQGGGGGGIVALDPSDFTPPEGSPELAGILLLGESKDLGASVARIQAFQQAQMVYGFADFDVALPEPTLRKTFADTAAWEPGVVTGPDGKATVKVSLPDNLTRWRATARGVSGPSLVGEGKAFVTARKEVLLRVDAPRFLVETDEVVIPSVVHNESGKELSGLLRMKADGVVLSGEDGPITVASGARGLRDRPVSVKAAGAVRIEAEVTSPVGGDRVETTLGAQPRGIRRIDGRSGSISTKAGEVVETFLEVPERTVPGSARLTVALAPSLDTAILDALTYLDLYPYGCVEQTVHRFLPATWARSALTAIGSPDAKRLADLDAAIRAATARLRNLANDDGSFGWFRGGAGDVTMTSLALLGLREAARLGAPGAQDLVNRTAAALLRIVRQAPDDVQALAHWALAAVDRPDVEAYQITFRRRNEELSVVGLSWMTFAALENGRNFDAEDLVRLLLARRQEENGATHWTGRPGHCLHHGKRLATGLAVRALVLSGTATDQAERGLAWLLAHRPDGGFGTTMETAAFVGAASAWVEKARPARFGGTVKVLLDGVEARAVKVLPTEPLAPADRRFALDVTAWKPGRHTLSFRLEGEGELRFAARLESVEAVEALTADEHGVKIERLYLDAEIPAIEGAELPQKPGYDVLRPAARPRVEAKSRDKVGTGERLLVRVTLTAPRDLDYVMIEDPLPAGCEVLDGTAAGPFDWQERRDDRQVFFLSHVKQGPVVLTYVLQAVHLGAFTALPARASAMYMPEVNGRSAGHRLSVLPGSSKGSDAETPPTPDELFARAKKLLEGEKWADAAAAFAALRDGHPLRDEILEEVEAALLRCAIETKDPKGIVRAREELIRRNPSRIPTDLLTTRAIAAAYADVGEHGVASGLFRSLIAGAFQAEAGWSDTLTARGREVEGLTALGALLESYPVSNGTAARALARATRFRELRRPAAAPGRAGTPMDEEGLAALRSFVAHYAETPLAAPASYALVDALRRTRALDEAEIEATAFPRRFPESAFVDDTLFFLMDTRLQKFETAPTATSAVPVLESADRLVKEQFPAPNGSKQWSEFAPRAWHAIARVRHVLGDLEAAIAAYRHVGGTIEDAREALAYLTEARLDLQESVTAPVAGTATFPVKYRNVGEIRFKAYPVDLQVLFAVRRTLEGLNRIDLSGIAPALEWSVTPKDGQDHAWHETAVELPTGKDAAGVYLVVAKAGDLETSTVVLKTDLKVVLQTVGEKVRVYVTDAAGKNVRGAYVTVSDGQAIKARGQTDGRGLFEAPGVGAKPFVVVSLDDRYAIAR